MGIPKLKCATLAVFSQLSMRMSICKTLPWVNPSRVIYSKCTTRSSESWSVWPTPASMIPASVVTLFLSVVRSPHSARYTPWRSSLLLASQSPLICKGVTTRWDGWLALNRRRVTSQTQRPSMTPQKRAQTPKWLCMQVPP